jgi:hypothetical protein
MEMHSPNIDDARPAEMATEEGWLLLQQRYTTHLLACDFQRGASCCGAWLAVTTRAAQCPTCQKTYSRPQ